jgi:ribosomal protein L15
MVAMLWGQGHNGATVRLEHLWHELCREEAFSLFCAYPRSGFTKDVEASIQEICSAHSKVIVGYPT